MDRQQFRSHWTQHRLLYRTNLLTLPEGKTSDGAADDRGELRFSAGWVGGGFRSVSVTRREWATHHYTAAALRRIGRQWVLPTTKAGRRAAVETLRRLPPLPLPGRRM